MESARWIKNPSGAFPISILQKQGMPRLAAGFQRGGEDGAVKLCARSAALALRKLRHIPAVGGKDRRGMSFPLALRFPRDLHMSGKAPLRQNAQLLKLPEERSILPFSGQECLAEGGQTVNIDIERHIKAHARRGDRFICNRQQTLLKSNYSNSYKHRH